MTFVGRSHFQMIFGNILNFLRGVSISQIKMIVDLIFIDSKRETARGFLRGLVLVVLILLFLVLLVPKPWSWRKGAGMLLFAVLLSSALSVAHPSSSLDAITYGALVGFVVAGCIMATYLMFSRVSSVAWPLLGVGGAVIISALLAWLLYKIDPEDS